MAGLRKLHEKADDVFRAFQGIQREDRYCGLNYLFLSKVDLDTRQPWSDKIATKQASQTLENVLDYLEERIYFLETTHASASKPSLHVAIVATGSSNFICTNDESQPPQKYSACNDSPHRLLYCKRFLEITPSQKKYGW